MDTPEKILAAIDIGTNSFHLVIAKIDEKGSIKIITREKEVVRLGKSSTDMKYISEDAKQILGQLQQAQRGKHSIKMNS